MGVVLRNFERLVDTINHRFLLANFKSYEFVSKWLKAIYVTVKHTFTCSKSTMEALENGVRYFQI